MKKKLSLTGLALVLVLFLAGCGKCEHQWTEADCLNAALCTKCQEAGEAAFGHDFVPATCTDPEICTRCGETQGSASGHTFGEWTIIQKNRTRSCSRCRLIESEEIDDETYARHMMNGHWDSGIMVTYGKQHTSHDQKSGTLPKFLDITNDGIRFSDENGIHDITLEYLEYDASLDRYLFTGNYEDNSSHTVIFAEGEQQNTICFFFDDKNYIEFSKYEQEKSVAVGTWVCMSNGSLFFITLNEDGTFTAELGEEFTGTWYMMPTIKNYGAHVGGCKLSCEKDGQQTVLDVELFYSYDEKLVWDLAKSNTLLDVTHNQEWVANKLFRKLQDPSDLDMLKAAMTADGKNKLLGTWVFESLTIRTEDSSFAETDLDFTITFSDDGTFAMRPDEILAASFPKPKKGEEDEPRRGTWSFDGVDGFHYGKTHYLYSTAIHNTKLFANLRLYDEYLAIYVYDQENDTHYNYTLVRIAE